MGKVQLEIMLKESTTSHANLEKEKESLLIRLQEEISKEQENEEKLTLEKVKQQEQEVLLLTEKMTNEKEEELNELKKANEAELVKVNIALNDLKQENDQIRKDLIAEKKESINLTSLLSERQNEVEILKSKLTQQEDTEVTEKDHQMSLIAQLRTEKDNLQIEKETESKKYENLLQKRQDQIDALVLTVEDLKEKNKNVKLQEKEEQTKYFEKQLDSKSRIRKKDSRYS